MSKATERHDSMMYFVAQVLNQKIYTDVEVIAKWFRDSKAWQYSTIEAIEKFKKWLPE